jgi:hypothetical protein
MSAARPAHRAEQHRSALPQVEALSLESDRQFARHAHDQYGLGRLEAGAQRRRPWRGRWKGWTRRCGCR